MEKVNGYHAMMLNIRGIRGLRESRTQKGKTIYHCYYKGEKKFAMAIISLVNAKLNEYFTKVRW